MRTTIELTTEVAKKMMWAKLEPFDFEHMPFERFDIEFPYAVFQTAEDVIKPFERMNKNMTFTQRQNLLRVAEQTIQKMVTLSVRKDSGKFYLKLTFDNDTLYDGYFIVEPVCLPVPYTVINGGHTNPTQYALMLFSLAIRTMDFLNSPKIIKESTQEKVDKKTGKKVYTTNKKKYVYNTRYVFKNAQEHLEKRTYTYHIDEWEQRGHYRTYKDGKKVWVKPCKKTRKSGDTLTKQDKNVYRITRTEN